MLTGLRRESHGYFRLCSSVPHIPPDCLPLFDPLQRHRLVVCMQVSFRLFSSLSNSLLYDMPGETPQKGCTDFPVSRRESARTVFGRQARVGPPPRMQVCFGPFCHYCEEKKHGCCWWWSFTAEHLYLAPYIYSRSHLKVPENSLTPKNKKRSKRKLNIKGAVCRPSNILCLTLLFLKFRGVWVIGANWIVESRPNNANGGKREVN